MSMSDVSDMLFELYRAKAPKNQQQNKFGQTSPTSAETHEPSSIAAIATNGASAVGKTLASTESKNLPCDGMVSIPAAAVNSIAPESNADAAAAPFHPRIQYTANQLVGGELKTEPTLTAIPTSVVVMPTSPQIDVKPLIHPTTGLVISAPAAASSSAAASVIKAVPVSAASAAAAAVVSTVSGGGVVPQAAAIAAALLRDGYHNFQQQLRAQELLKQQNRAQLGSGGPAVAAADIAGTTSSKLLENFLRQQRDQQHERDEMASDTNDGDDEDDSRYNGFDDIQLVESSKHNYSAASLPQLFQGGASTSTPGSGRAPTGDFMSDESKYLIAAHSQALRNFEFNLGEYGGGAGNGRGPGSVGGNTSPNGSNETGEAVYECRHCGKKYRWKSTLRRHENVECGGKEPSHQCPYCPYKSKQRGNLGVHVRKHHANLPQLASKRRSKYSQKMESGNSSANMSDDSSSKLIIDCPKYNNE